MLHERGAHERLRTGDEDAPCAQIVFVFQSYLLRHLPLSGGFGPSIKCHRSLAHAMLCPSYGQIVMQYRRDGPERSILARITQKSYASLHRGHKRSPLQAGTGPSAAPRAEWSSAIVPLPATSDDAVIANSVEPSMNGSRPSFRTLFSVFARIGLLSFGGPAAQIALMHRTLVDERKWLSEERFLNALNFCMLLPGPEAMQLATYAGWSLHGLRGGLAAGLLFILPGIVIVLLLSALYVALGSLPWVEALFFGIKAAVLAIVIEALFRIARRSLRLPSDWWIAGAAFLALCVFAAPFPLVIAAAAVIGFARNSSTAASTVARPGFLSGTLVTLVCWLTLWF